MSLSYKEAFNILSSKNMVLLSKSSVNDREYWGFMDFNVFIDHSATITKVGHNIFAVSDFSDSKAEHPYEGK